MNKTRCKWAAYSKELQKYHDFEYGYRIKDDLLYFERLILEIFQAGLSWEIILKKRKAFQIAFDRFNFYKIAEYKEKKINELLNNNAIVRNSRKIYSTIYNAKKFIDIIKEYKSFDNYIRSFNYFDKNKVLKIFKNQFKFIGPLIIEEFMMSVGLWKVKHEKECFLYNK